MKIHPSTRRFTAGIRVRKGFALVVTLSLMILLTVIAVGLLTLSSINLRSSSQGDAMQAARANARLALMLAIGDLQKQLGPDTRISATADQIPSAADPAVSSIPKSQRQWAGAYNSWATAAPNATRPTPEFLQWFVSGDPAKVKLKSFAETTLGSGAKESVEIVGVKTVGPTADTVRVPLMVQSGTTGPKNNFAWWTSDLGTKGLIAPAKEIPTSIAATRADQQAAPAFDLKAAVANSIKPFSTLSPTNPLLANVVSWQSGALLASNPQDVGGLFHDFTSQSRGLITNVRKGGFRQDLSMLLERPAASAPVSTTSALYKIGTENGINLNELWVYYNLYKEVKRTGGATFTTSGTMSTGTPYLQVEATPEACKSDDEFHFKQPVIISYQLALSFEVRPTTNAGQTVNRLHVVADPILTFWNPLDVPVTVPSGTVFTVKYWQIPYDITISKNGVAQTYPLAASLSGATTSVDGDSNFLSLQVGQLGPLAFKPGEVIKMSQSGTTLAKVAGASDRHKLAGKKGFNYGGGVALPFRTRGNAYLDVGPNDTILYVRAQPNNLTAGATNVSGNTVESDGTSHTRHFSLTHHEYYVGDDRGDLAASPITSLGIGGMFLDYDFGNKRLAPGAIRDTYAQGTKTSGRYTANEKNNIFKTFTDGRKLPVTGKVPFMLLSFNAKTETGSDLGTRALSRFNPKALHVDFYDLSDQERDMLPYEYTVESLDSWKNRSLEVSSNGGAFFGGGMNAADGTPFVTTHSVPREPIVSLAAFQHSFANGFEIQKPKHGYGTLNAREPLLPQISHAIGNSTASPMIAKDSTQGTLPGGRPMADHSYLANQALWDDYFLSGIAPQNVNTFSSSRTQKVVASDFFSGKTGLPVARYKANLRGQDPTKLTNTYFSGSIPSAAATVNIASFLRVDGMFNVNSTSVEAWKSLLGARKERPILVRDANGKESIQAGDATTPVAGLLGPTKDIAESNSSVDVSDTNQWIGRRVLNDQEIDLLARAIVKEVRKRGPFLSLADFINRRVGSDTELARAGAIQSALDSPESKINQSYQSGDRATTAASRFTFPQAEEGPISQGIPGIIKQADILTPIAPVLSARSDSFLVRGYGEKTDSSGKVLARAWCEAVVQRSAEFVDSTDIAEKSYTTISTLNKTFGRRFEIVSFRWLNSSEI